jgi:hypothetical protein
VQLLLTKITMKLSIPDPSFEKAASLEKAASSCEIFEGS